MWSIDLSSSDPTSRLRLVCLAGHRRWVATRTVSIARTAGRMIACDTCGPLALPPPRKRGAKASVIVVGATPIAGWQVIAVDSSGNKARVNVQHRCGVSRETSAGAIYVMAHNKKTLRCWSCERRGEQ